MLEFDRLSLILSLLVLWVAGCIGSYSKRYMLGDGRYTSFRWRLWLLAATVCCMVSADHIWLFFSCWVISNALLVRMMIHKTSWAAARNSGMLALGYFIAGSTFLAAGLWMMSEATRSLSLHEMVAQADIAQPVTLYAMLLITLAAFIQSSIWPMHRWLLSSLNSPTPVSALMHAGLVNGGGVLVIRFAAVYLKLPMLLDVLFVAGLLTAITGTLWKLMQSDIKRMLACSTMGQMGFMVMQCGLGLFPAAVAHICWHGLFKAYLFLSSGGIASEKRLDLNYPPGMLSFVMAALCAASGTYAFCVMAGKPWVSPDTTLVLMVIAGIAATQFALTMLRTKPVILFPVALLLTSLMGGLYGLSVHAVELLLQPMQLMQPQPLNPLHIYGMLLFAGFWLAALFAGHFTGSAKVQSWIARTYVAALNAAQPAAATITSHRNNYSHI